MLSGTTGRPAGASFQEGGAIARVLKEADAKCDNVGIYEYQDAQAATAGLSDWLTQQNIKANQVARTDQAVVWTAEAKEYELIGQWTAPNKKHPGLLEMCYHSLFQETSVGIPVKLIAWLLIGVGGLGSAGGTWWTRMQAQGKARQQVAK